MKFFHNSFDFIITTIFVAVFIFLHISKLICGFIVYFLYLFGGFYKIFCIFSILFHTANREQYILKAILELKYYLHKYL